MANESMLADKATRSSVTASTLHKPNIELINNRIRRAPKTACGKLSPVAPVGARYENNKSMGLLQKKTKDQDNAANPND